MTKEALKLALEALEDACGDRCNAEYNPCFQREAITAIKEALAQPEQEPCCYGGIAHDCHAGEGCRIVKRMKVAHPEQEPVACDCDSPSWCKQYKKCNRKMLGFMPYVAQPQRTWVGLTDGEVDKMILLMGFPPDWITENAIVKNIVRNLEAKLKEKNT
jgi:hypothetical protein